jgi:hypothetical protein
VVCVPAGYAYSDGPAVVAEAPFDVINHWRNIVGTLDTNSKVCTTDASDLCVELAARRTAALSHVERASARAITKGLSHTGTVYVVTSSGSNS